MSEPTTRNRLLRTLPPGELEELLLQFERVDVHKGEILITVGHTTAAGLRSAASATRPWSALPRCSALIAPHTKS